MNKTLVFDMDGTIADLYNVENWLEDLRAYNPRPYEVASPLYNMTDLIFLVKCLQMAGWTIAITSWLSKESTPDYDREVRRAKREWLDRHGFPYDEIHLVAYGTTKANCTRKNGGYQVLVDDNAKVRNGWNLGATIDATENILEELWKLLDIQQFP